MKLDKDVVHKFSRVITNVMYCKKTLEEVKDEYEKLLPDLKGEGSGFEFKDACILCNLGFFMSHNSLTCGESMHAYFGKIYYEDGACLSTTGILDNPYEWMECGWYIKACPHEVDFKKLKDMHDRSRGMCLSGQSYEECIIKR